MTAKSSASKGSPKTQRVSTGRPASKPATGKIGSNSMPKFENPPPPPKKKS